MVVVTPHEPSAEPPPGLAARLMIRRREHTGPTSGLAPGYVQGNLAVVPGALAADFREFCRLNPKPCPLLASSAQGDWRMPELAADLDIRTDLPRYRIWRNGRIADEPNDVRDWWRDDLVAFVLGCSFSFEEALLENGIELRHITCGCAVPMYRTTIATVGAGPFHGPMVVSMRPLSSADAARAVEITARYPRVHGAPVHIGAPQALGIDDLATPDYGDPVPIRDGEIPVFWACGVTPQAVIETVKPEFCITHYPAAMLVTDLRNVDLATSA